MLKTRILPMLGVLLIQELCHGQEDIMKTAVNYLLGF